MSIVILTQVYDEVRRLAIAGSAVAGGDFRLKKLIPPLEQAGQKVPVFAKVAQAATQLIESNEQNSAAALLELSTLINAILYTQGETGCDGKLQPIETIDLGQQQTQTSARLLKPLLEALTNTGSGRLEVIRESHEAGAFRDLRLIEPALKALDDPYAEIADFIAAKVLPLYGRAILPRLREDFDLKGKGGSARRLRLIAELDPEGAANLVAQALENGSKEVKIAAIACLGKRPEDMAELLELTKSKSKQVRQAAYEALGRSSEREALQALCQVIQSNDLELAIPQLQASQQKEVLQAIHAELRAQLKQLLSGTDKAKQSKAAQRMLLLLRCLNGRTDKQTEKLLIELFQQRDALAKAGGSPSGRDVLELLVQVISDGPKGAQKALADAHETLSDEILPTAMMAALRCLPAAEVFERFSPYLIRAADSGRKMRKGKPEKKRQALAMVFFGAGRWKRMIYAGYGEKDYLPDNCIDPRWLDLAVNERLLLMASALAVPGHDGLNALLQQEFESQIKKTVDGQMNLILETMVEVGHPRATDALLTTLRKEAKSPYFHAYMYGRLIPQLPPEALPQLEALLPTLSERAVKQLLPYVDELRQRSAELVAT